MSAVKKLCHSTVTVASSAEDAGELSGSDHIQAAVYFHNMVSCFVGPGIGVKTSRKEKKYVIKTLKCDTNKMSVNVEEKC